MAEIKVERDENRRPGWLPWVVGLLLLALVLWGLSQCRGENATDPAPAATDTVAPAGADQTLPATTPVVDPATVQADPGGAPGTGGAIPIAQIVASPGGYLNQTSSGTVRVAEVVSDKGFWVEENGQRMYVVLNEPPEQARQIRAGQTLQLSGTVYDRNGLNQIQTRIEDQDRRIIEGQPAFLYIPAVQQVQVVGQL